MLRPSVKDIRERRFVNEGDARQIEGGQFPFAVTSSQGFHTTQLTNLAIVATTFTAPSDVFTEYGTLVFEFDDTPDLSEVMVGNYLRVSSCDDPENVGEFEISAVNDGADTITVLTKVGVTNASSGGYADTQPFLSAFKIHCTTNTSGLTIVDSDGDTIDYGELTAGISILGDFADVTIGTSGEVIVYGK